MKEIHCGKYRLPFNEKTLIMGILNVNPDSFSDGGKYNNLDKALKHAVEMVENGADILDIGGESTRPGYIEITAEEEIERVVPIIELLSKEVDVPISIDTYKASVARSAMAAGAHIINDIWGAKREPEIATVAADYDAPIILMHNRNDQDYQSFIDDVLADMKESINISLKAGVNKDKIILDPGIGFAKNLTTNLEMMRNLDKLVALGYPVLLGTSKKSMIGNVLDLPVSERMEGTGATVCFGIQKGCQIIRVHDVKEMTRMARMMDALMGKGQYSG
ncbi:dihydropteroate synthase [Niallia taxi]|uniref:Dihydropteroate synthase n=1 Tax=Niallia taxi TaxID=2499688 RepID=A0A437K3D2_9BACI|nr:dihydropteroate synthase [Niallia taxi]MCM3218074.1 dihydropteroate synthase [Niallia taxi]MED4040132.1 dihydropteroate synthase [Niallia taxi]MED4056166.1 dihydropteroate synthase [Niallia taxi]MED4120608.1 dihydropteroate synthase [Niallia taxi]RVT56748.1 dihydropteroate synthase [Niallia taxi]